MFHRARVVARLTAVLTTVGIVLSGPVAAAADERRVPQDRVMFGPSWIISGAVDDDEPPASVSSAWPKGSVEEADDVLDVLLSDTPSEVAREEIPGIMLRLYRDSAAGCEGLPWAVLAGMGAVVSDHGRDLETWRERVGGPLGWPAPLWREHAVDGDGDGVVDRRHAADAIASATAYLCAESDGDAFDLDSLREALARFLGDADEVEPVLAAALTYVDQQDAVADELTEEQTAPVTTPASAEEPESARGAEAAEATDEIPVGDIAALLSNPNITWTDRERNDIRRGLIDGRVLGLLAALARDHEITVVVLKTGHSRFIAGTTKESHHYHGRAVDITSIDGEPVSATSSKAYSLARWLDALPPSLRPAEVGSPFADLEQRPGFFTDSMHQHHVHIGWGPR